MSNLIDRLRKRKDDRGLMANLRCLVVDNKKHRGWPALNRLGVSINDYVSAYIAGLFAIHSEETSNGNFGMTCKSIEDRRDERDKSGDDIKLTPTERRFQHLLAAEKGDELYRRVLRMVLMAKSQEVRVNYEQLETDLRFWSDRVRTEWAASFWTPKVSAATEEES